MSDKFSGKTTIECMELVTEDMGGTFYNNIGKGKNKLDINENGHTFYFGDFISKSQDRK